MLFGEIKSLFNDNIDVVIDNGNETHIYDGKNSIPEKCDSWQIIPGGIRTKKNKIVIYTY